MAKFTAGQPITTATPTIVVDAGLPVGSHRFQLEVVDTSGLRSKADVQVVAVQRGAAPPITHVTPVVPPVPPITPIR